MNDKQDKLKEMEIRLAEIKAGKYDTPQQAKARKMIKPVLMTIAAIFIFLFFALIIDAMTDPVPKRALDNTPTVAVVDEANAAKWKALAGVSDCQLAQRVYNDYQPIFAELHSYLTQTNPPTYEQLNNWKQSHRLDERVDTLDNKYPSSYQVSMENTLVAKNLSFAIGQYWRDAFARQRSSNNQGPIESDQPGLMHDDLQLLKQNCPEEFGKVS